MVTEMTIDRRTSKWMLQGAHFVNVASSLATLTSPGLSLVFISMR